MHWPAAIELTRRATCDSIRVLLPLCDPGPGLTGRVHVVIDLMPLIKRYPNRKLYDTDAKSYVTLDEVTEMIRAGQDVHVIDHETGDDLTTLTLSQIILEQEKKSSGFLPRTLLTSLIRTGGDTLDHVMRSVQSGLGVGGEEDEEQADGAEQVGKAASKAAHAQALVDERIADVLKILNVPTRRDMRQLQEQLAALSQRLEEMTTQQEDDNAAETHDPSSS